MFKVGRGPARAVGAAVALATACAVAALGLGTMSVAAATGPQVVTISGTMDGNLPVSSGDTLEGGFDVTAPGDNSGVDVSVTDISVVMHVSCGDQTIPIPDQEFADVNGGDWSPSGNNISQGSTTAGCSGSYPDGATFTGTFACSPAADIHVRFDYGDGSTGGWSATVDVPGCGPNPTTVVAEAPWPILLPLSMALAGGVGLLLFWRRSESTPG